MNRLSIGVQSFADATLKRLGRAHRGGEGRATFAAARDAGFANVSLDLLLAAPGQTHADLDADLDAFVACEPEHVSAYALTLEEGTPFERAARSRQARAAGRGRRRSRCWNASPSASPRRDSRATRCRASRAPGRESRHNRRYWEREPVLGIGPGAWSSEAPRDGGAVRRAPRQRAQPRRLAGAHRSGPGGRDRSRRRSSTRGRRAARRSSSRCAPRADSTRPPSPQSSVRRLARSTATRSTSSSPRAC